MKIKKPNIGVIGVGHLGQYHTKHFKSISKANLIGVYDTDHNRGNEIAKTYIQFHEQEKSSWAWEIELRPWVENF